MTIRDEDDPGDAASRKANRAHLETRRRTIVVGGRWARLHPFKATVGERVLAYMGAIILAVVLIAFVLEYLGVIEG